MLNEKITITICGKNYRLKTDNSEQLIAAAKNVEDRITEYCANVVDLGKEDAAVFSALDCFNELGELKNQCAKLAAEVERLRKGEEAAVKAVEESKALSAENASLKKSKEELDKLTKRFSELEGKNAQLAETLKEANEKAAKVVALEKELSEARKTAEGLEKKNAQLSAQSKESTEKQNELNKTIAQKDKRITELEKEQTKAVSVGEENKRLSDKLTKAENFEEAFHREQKRAESAEKERDSLKSTNEQLNKSVSEYRVQVDQLSERLKCRGEGTDSEREKKLKSELDSANAARERLDKDYEELSSAYDELDKANKELTAQRDELKVKFSQIESENNALKQSESGGDNGELEKLRDRFDEINQRNAELTAEIKALKKTNASLDKQLKEMLEDGQLTL